ncbi:MULTISPECIES: ABC transporter permease [unclassified Leucobacter]|uniref:ABC transporter permease n=1 Tax=unclassified Leucobacter TaxID=2621730 RepID=UPI00165E4A48|nr:MULTISPECIES: ABC transporter permease [unclassified Leucobacter]MBC9927523.1 ABC transporter permease [Leucobacter sp. cx-169]
MTDAGRRQGRSEIVVLEHHAGFFTGVASSWRDVWNARGLLFELIASSIRTRYKNSKLGVLWSFARPLVQLLIYYFAIGQILGVARAIPDFAIFVFIGLTVWALFGELINSMTTSVVDNAGIVKKVYFPRELFPLSTVGTSVFNFLFQLAVLLLAVAVFGSVRWSWDLLLIPLAILTLIVFSLAIGLFLAAVNVRLRDVQHLVEVLLSVLFWASPIVYSFSFVQSALGSGLAMNLYMSNPVTLVVLALQKALWSAGYEAGQTWDGDFVLHLLITLLVSCVLLFFTHRYFLKMQGSFAQEL